MAGAEFICSARDKPGIFFCRPIKFPFRILGGKSKYILNATLDGKKANGSEQANELYDLRQDPMESTNLAEQLPVAVAQGQQRLAAWVQYHNEFMNSLFLKN